MAGQYETLGTPFGSQWPARYFITSEDLRVAYTCSRLQAGTDPTRAELDLGVKVGGRDEVVLCQGRPEDTLARRLRRFRHGLGRCRSPSCRLRLGRVPPNGREEPLDSRRCAHDQDVARCGDPQCVRHIAGQECHATRRQHILVGAGSEDAAAFEQHENLVLDGVNVHRRRDPPGTWARSTDTCPSVVSTEQHPQQAPFKLDLPMFSGLRDIGQAHGTSTFKSPSHLDEPERTHCTSARG